MPKTITIATHHFIIAIIIVLIIILLLFYKSINAGQKPPTYNVEPQKDVSGALILDGKRVPIEPELKKFLATEGYITVRLTNAKGQVKIVDRNGIEIPPCGETKEEIGVPPSCNLNGINLVTISQTLRFVHTKNPECTTERVGSRFITYHASGIHAGKSKCHDPHN